MILVVPVTNHKPLNLKILLRKRKKQDALSFQDKTWPNFMILLLYFLSRQKKQKLATVTIRDVLILQVKW